MPSTNASQRTAVRDIVTGAHGQASLILGDRRQNGTNTNPGAVAVVGNLRLRHATQHLAGAMLELKLARAGYDLLSSTSVVLSHEPELWR